MINSLRLTPDNELLIAACQLRPKNLQLNILWQPRWAPVHPLRIPRSIPQYLTIPHKTSQYYHSTSSVNSATINQTLRLSRTLEKGPPTHPPPIRNPAFPIAKSPFSRPGPSRGTDQLTIFDLFDAHWVFCLFCKRLFFNYFSMWPSVAISGRRCGIFLEIFRRWYFWQLWWDSNRRQSKANIGSLLDRCTAIIIGWQFV